MPKALIGRLRIVEPFPLSPFPFRDGGTKSEKAIVQSETRFLKIPRTVKRTPSPEREGGQGVGFQAKSLFPN